MAESAHPRPLLALTLVRQLHSKRSFTNDYMAPYSHEVCAECRQVWPCATEQAIQKALDVPAATDSNGDANG